jgi:hypothetical protein
MAKSKFFCVAVAGATASDGRTIEPAWIDQMAKNYNQKTYGARVNLEHIKGYDPASPFKAYGDVVALKADTIAIAINGKTEQRKALFAQIDPTAELVEIVKKRQKIYTSIEVAPNFASTNEAGLVGLAATDNPASLGTDMLAFAATNAGVKAMFDSRKQDPANCFSAAHETSFEIEPEGAAADAAEAGGLFAAFLAGLKSFGQGASPAPAEGGATAPQGSTAPAASPGGHGGGAEAGAFATLMAGMTALSADAAKDRKAMSDAVAKLTGEVADLKTKLDTTPAGGGQRQMSSGGSGDELADF